MDPMARRLQRRFVLLATLAMGVVMLVLCVGLNLFSFWSQYDQSMHALEYLSLNGGQLPETPPQLRDGSPQAEPPFWTPETRYQLRYCSVWLDKEENPLFIMTDHVASISTQEALEYARAALGQGRESGRLEQYRYLVTSGTHGSLVVFLDCAREFQTARSLLLISTVVYLAVLAAVFGVSLLISGRAVHPIVESLRRQKQFITNAGHELKTPLSIINANVDVLSLTQGESQWLTSIQHQTRRMSRLIQEMLKLARLDEGSKPAFSEVDLSALVEEMAADFSLLAQSGGRSFSSTVQPGLRLHAHEAGLRELLSILLDNAVKYSTPEGAISLSLEKHGRRLRLQLANDVPAPLTQEQLGHLFDRFYRGDGSRSSQTAGYGLGLAIAREIAERHHGKLSAANQEGKNGAQVVFTLLM